jgi:hypothetical protein
VAQVVPNNNNKRKESVVDEFCVNMNYINMTLQKKEYKREKSSIILTKKLTNLLNIKHITRMTM